MTQPNADNHCCCLACDPVSGDEASPYGETPQQRFERIRAWVVSNLQPIPIEDTP